MDSWQSFGEWLRHRRRALDLTQDALARQVGCARVTIRKLEAEEIRPSRQLAELLAAHLQIPSAERETFVRLGRGGAPAVAAASPPGPRHNLPVHPNSFIGRERELAAVRQLMGRARLVTLTGPGGTGKTRLALQTAADLLDTADYPDGVWWVELAPLRDPALAGQAVARAAGVREIPNQPVLDTLVEALRSQRLLLALDNCEHLILACAELAGRLLGACPGLRLLATSREALDIAGETAWPVPALALPDPRAPLALPTLSTIESIRLFTERAQAVRPGFELSTSNAPTVAQVCRRLSGMPLAIELAAARVKMMSVEEIARRLDARFDLLTAGSRTALPRQQTLRAAIDWSFDLLSEPERVLFQRLSVFAGGFSLAAAEAVAAGGLIAPAQVVDLLGQLINKSLVNVDERAPLSVPPLGRPAGAASTRYGMLETILEYACQKNEAAGEADDSRARHLEYFCALAQEAENGIYSADQAAWYRRLDQDLDNMRAALSWTRVAADTDDPQRRTVLKRQLLIVGSLTTYWENHNQREIVETLATLLARDQANAPSRERAKALCAGGFVLWSANKLAQARVYLEESIQIAEALNDPLTLVFSLGFLGWTFDFLKEYAAAQAALERAVMIGRTLGERGQQAIGIPLSLLGDIPYQQGDWPAARRLYEEAIVYIREIRNKNILTYPLRRLAYLELHDGRLGQAAACLRESLALNRELNHLQGMCACLVGFANLRVDQGRLEQAARLCACVEAQLQGLSMPLYLVDNVNFERCAAHVRAALEPAALSAAWAEGRAMPVDDAIEDALNEKELAADQP